jgi:integrase
MASPVAVIAAWLGHASSAFTQRTYLHSQPEALAGAAARLDDLYGGQLRYFCGT